MAVLSLPSNEREARCAVLVRRLQTGDDGAFAEFMAATRSRVTWEMHLRGLRSSQDREDCLQGIYFEFWQRRHRVWPEQATGYLMRIACSRIRATFNSANRRPDRPVSNELEWTYIPDTHTPGPERVTVAKEATAEVQDRCGQVVAALPAHLRSVLRAYVQDLSPEETAHRLGLPLYQVWDFTLEALSEAKRIAGAPTTNPEIEHRLRECELWPAECVPLPLDVGQILRRLPVGQRLIIYSRLMGMNSTETARHIGLANIKSQSNIIRTKLRLLAECFGCVPATGARAAGVVPLAEAATVLHLRPKVAQQAAEDAGVVLTATEDGRPGVRLADFPTVWAAAITMPPKKGGRPAAAR